MALIDGGFALIREQASRIDTIVPDVVMRETGRNDLAITDHPVESGAPVSDHAFKLPPSVEMICVFSASPNGDDYPSDMLVKLLRLQETREPIDVYTNIRPFENMLIQSVSQTRDKDTGCILLATVRCRRINIVSTKTTSTKEAGKANQQSPQTTGSTAKAVDQQLKPVSSGSAAP